jgi:Ca-activated chloride channel family protein
MNLRRRFSLLVLAILCGVTLTAAPQQQDGEGSFRFRTGVELINVTATVTDASGRFVSGLTQDDFLVYEDDEPQAITHFESSRVPVSLGLVVDTSGSMAGEKWRNAQEALDRFLLDLLSPEDEVFMYRFSNHPILVEDWTTDRRRLSRAMGRIRPSGGTAMYDTIADAVPLADSGRNRKKAVVVVSDGNDTNSETQVFELKQMIRQSEVLVYAVGIDGRAEIPQQPTIRRPPPVRIPFPFPGPGRRRPWPTPPPRSSGRVIAADYSVNVGALRELTNDTGGRTEIVRTSRDLGPATANIAAELSKQYYLAYPATAKKDGRWHSIRVEVRDHRYVVRARRGYVAD